MSISVYFDFHPDTLFLLPLLGLRYAKCDSQDCRAEHWVISTGWLLWTVSVVLQ